MNPTALATGTSGFSYDAWKGVFYPEGLPAKGRLAYYASRLGAVEINNTFYRMPRRSVLEGWCAQVPESFRFSIKASRRITHFKRLSDVGDETAHLLDVTAALGPRLGALLFQLPPGLAHDAERLERFLDLLPEGTPAAVEFRHPSWIEEGAPARLAERGFTAVGVDPVPWDQEAGTGVVVAPGARLAYLRLRRPGYEAAELARLAEQLLASQAQRALAFFKHEDAGAGPRLAERFLAVVEAQAARRAPLRAGRKGEHPGVRRGA